MPSLETGFPGAEFKGGLPAARAHHGLQQALLAPRARRSTPCSGSPTSGSASSTGELGYSSIQAYAGEALGFSPSKTSQFLRLAETLEALPLMKAAAANGEIPWTKLREVARVATPASEREWVAEARCSSRRTLAAKVTQVKEQARQDRRAIRRRGLWMKRSPRRPSLFSLAPPGLSRIVGERGAALRHHLSSGWGAARPLRCADGEGSQARHQALPRGASPPGPGGFVEGTPESRRQQSGPKSVPIYPGKLRVGRRPGRIPTPGWPLESIPGAAWPPMAWPMAVPASNWPPRLFTVKFRLRLRSSSTNARSAGAPRW